MTDTQKRLAYKYLLYKFLTNAWFISAVWLYFYRLFITDQQSGFLDSIAFTIGLIAEVPSGALADKLGRDKLVRIGQITAGTGLLIQALSSAFIPIAIGQAMLMVGFAFISGADDALFYENLHFDSNSVHWKKLVTRGTQVALISSLLATLAGGLMHPLNPRVPWILNGLAFMSSVIIIWSIRDPRPRQVRQGFKVEFKEYIQDIRNGFGHFMSSRLWFYVPFIITVQGLFYTTSYGLLRMILLDRFHFDAFGGSVIVGLSSLATVVLLSLLHRYSDKISEKQMFTLIGLLCIFALLASIPNIGYFGAIVIFILHSGSQLLMPSISDALNKHALPDQRATVLSVASFYRTLPYVPLAPIIGSLSTDNRLEYFLGGWAILILIAVVIYLFANHKDTQIELA